MNKSVAIIGVPSDYGQRRRGVDMGPSAIRYAGVVERLEALGYAVKDEGDIRVEKAPIKKEQNEKLLNLDEVVEVCSKLAQKVEDAVNENHIPLVLGGDHSIAIGTLAGLEKYKNLGVIWFDAHADINTPESTPSGNIHGMPLAVSLGLGHERLTSIHHAGPKVKAENIIIIGARSVDEGERELIKEKNIKVYTMHEVDRLGMTAVMEDAIRYLQERGVDGVHLSLDLDGLDPLYTPGVGTPVAGGITYRESHLAMEMLQEASILTSVEFVEVNPILDEKNKTANVAVALIGSLFGETLV
ncbi:arginase [Metasolibacillus sp.]|uniref:arginase n=1 Tax=Metasolibacillus sp. TaxID=2703680 RepID=UPI0025EF7E64|nr:arginase [Metasolibacillus sp.]MCT6924769.1 arginase [Metasolibacillus sp.]MCT6941037.1 arginase [Metasolibacillus sp.]